jgi:accessory secretory protein Asp1
MTELLGAYLRPRRRARDTVVLALSEQHNDLVASTLGAQTLVVSHADARPPTASTQLLRRAGAAFTDAGTVPEDDPALAAEWARLPLLSIYPLERRSTFGASANESTVYISLLVDDIDPDELDYAIAAMAPQLVGDDRTRLLVCSARPRDLDHVQAVRRVIAGYQHLDLALVGDENARLGADLGVADPAEEMIQLAFVDREADLIHTMARSRVLVDLGPRVNRRLAAAAVDAGVPQINRHEQELSTHLINGYVIGDDDELPTALDYFLSGLEHWNQSLVQCRVLEDLFSAQEILRRWDLVKEGVMYARAADRP